MQHASIPSFEWQQHKIAFEQLPCMHARLRQETVLQQKLRLSGIFSKVAMLLNELNEILNSADEQNGGRSYCSEREHERKTQFYVLFFRRAKDMVEVRIFVDDATTAKLSLSFSLSQCLHLNVCMTCVVCLSTVVRLPDFFIFVSLFGGVNKGTILYFKLPSILQI